GTYSYAYDDTSGGGKLKSVITPDGVETMYTFDGPMMTSAQTTGTDVAATIEFAYDTDFRLTNEHVECPTGTTIACAPVQYTYDGDSLLTMAATQAGQLILSRDPQNGLLTGTSVQAISDQWTYNAFAEPASYAATLDGDNTPFYTEQMTRDDAGRITEKVETIAGASTTSDYTYDNAGRLTTVSTNGVNSGTYTYDANSNRVSKTMPSGSESGTYDAQDRITTYAGATYTQTPTGDLQSRTDSSGTATYTYDELGNLLTVMLSDGRRIDYVVDGQNRRIAKMVNGAVVQRLVYADALRPAAELDGSGEVVTRFVYGTRANCPDLISKGDDTYRVIADHLGSPRLIVNIYDGTIVQRMDYDEFGNVIADSNPGFQPFGFAGGLYDSDTGLLRFGTRDYDPHSGRWTAKDPIGFDGGDTNLFGYAFRDPINFIDPNGFSGVLTIHSNGVNDSSDVPYAGHSWITYSSDGGLTHSYGTYGNNPGGNDNGLVTDWELNHPAQYGLGSASRTIWINDSQERHLMHVIDQYRQRGTRGWSYSDPCSSFAHDAWLAATGENLDDYHHGWTATTEQSLPQSLRESIIRENGGIAH
ncbi:MAG: RHS repeat-associated core domain-containing protein, partial [Thermoanaerobaculia bacterium]